MSRASRSAGARLRAHAPGRVNLIGDHTDYSGGLVLPCAIDRGTTVEGVCGGVWVRLCSRECEGEARIPLAVDDSSRLRPAWARYAAGVVCELRPPLGFDGEIRSTLPIAAGLSSSASLTVALALALGFEGPSLELARLCQRAEQRASGVPCGIMDPLVVAASVEGCALRIDCASLTLTPVRIPEALEIRVLHSGVSRRLAGSEYAQRRAQCEAAAACVGPLRRARLRDLDRIEDPVLRRRARHVVTENARVDAFVAALRGGDLLAAGALMLESHRSLRDDFEVSSAPLDRLVERLSSIPGVLGARLTGAGFGGCVVALCEHGALEEGWGVRPSRGARWLADFG
ncbi:MAG: galactokinase [Myxococcota bacterium]